MMSKQQTPLSCVKFCPYEIDKSKLLKNKYRMERFEYKCNPHTEIYIAIINTSPILFLSYNKSILYCHDFKKIVYLSLLKIPSNT